MRLLRLWRLAGKDLQLLWFALWHPQRPLWLAPAVVLLGLYALDPLNLALPFAGAMDDLVLVPLLLHLLLKLLPAEVRADFDRRPVPR
jgi:uncharacterized membrane protein YkvA (DUF1232 family)